MGFVGLLVWIKSAVEGTSDFAPESIPAFIPDNNYAYTPFSFADYLTALQAQRQCTADGWITGMPRGGDNWQVPLVKCDHRLCTTPGEEAQQFCEYAFLALAGANPQGLQRANDMKQYLLDRYPVLKQQQADSNNNNNNNTALLFPFSFDLIQVFDTSDDMDRYVKRGDYGNADVPKIAMGIVWDGNEPTQYAYSLRPNSTNFNNPADESRPTARTTPDTNDNFESYAKTDQGSCELDEGGEPDQGPLTSTCTGQYLYNGVLTFSRLIGDYIMNRTGAEENGLFVAEAGVKYVQFPERAYEEEGFYGDISDFAPLIIVLGMLYPIAAMIGYVTREKELRQKELMKMMSVTESDIGWGWFMSFFLLHGLVTTALTTLTATSLYESSDGFLMWVFWLCTFTSFIVFCMLISTFTAKATRAILIGLLVFFGGYFLTIAVDYETSSGGVLSLIGLHPVAAFSFGIQEIGRLEDLGLGITSDSIDLSDNSSGFNFRSALNALFFDSILWGVVTWYLNRVIRPDFGQALPWYFPFTKAYWRPALAAKSSSPADEFYDEDHSAAISAEIPLEPVGEALHRQSQNGENIEIRGLRKDFGDKTAVDGLNLSMYKGQITALLGHNGAGKTTVINMLTGAMEPTAGYALVAGKDIRTPSLIREDIGICLQHDCLFPQLTVREHIQFFSRLKGLYSNISRAEAEEHVDQAIADVALSEKRHTLSKNLSGGTKLSWSLTDLPRRSALTLPGFSFLPKGMKRKLSVAMAFCGGSKVVLLDEPTSGMGMLRSSWSLSVVRMIWVVWLMCVLFALQIPFPGASPGT